jgi:hypothetical protein
MTCGNFDKNKTSHGKFPWLVKSNRQAPTAVSFCSGAQRIDAAV